MVAPFHVATSVGARLRTGTIPQPVSDPKPATSSSACPVATAGEIDTPFGGHDPKNR